MSAQEKREQQMKAMGIEASDLDTKGLQIHNAPKTKPISLGTTGSAIDKKEEKIDFEPINLETLRSQKTFLKATKKQQKELETMRKRHQKERLAIQKNQCSAIEKAAKGKRDVVDDPAIKNVVAEQMNQRSEMVERHRKEEWNILKEHLKSQEEVLKKHMEAEQTAQLKQLEAKHEQEVKDMKTSQARAAVETAKEVQSDRTLKNKNDRDRRLKEKNHNNTKKFIQERKDTAIKQGKQKERLKKTHEQQMAELTRDIQLAIQLYENTEAEYKM